MLIATRILKLATNAGVRDVPVGLYAPEQVEGVWKCRFEIGWPEGPWSQAAAGTDAIQALELALKLIGVELYGSDHHKSGALVWETPGGGYGFPVPRAMRHLLVGDDKTFDG